MIPDAPDGHGRYAALDADEDGRLVCHECGRTWLQLATHVLGAHGMTATQYRAAHGLAVSTRLVGAATRERLRVAFDRHRDVHLEALAEHRDPDRARAAMTGTWAPEVRARRAAVGRASRGRALTPRERQRLDATGVDLQAWADVARELLALDGVSARALADAADISPATVQQRLRRYPAR